MKRCDSSFDRLTKQHLILFILALTLGLILWASPWFLLRYGAAFVLLWILPGLAWALLIPRRALDRIERLAVSLGLSYVVTPITILLLSYISGPLTQAQLLVAMLGMVGLPLGLSMLARRLGQGSAGTPATPESKEQHPGLIRRHGSWQKSWVWLLVALLIAAGLRVTNLNYSEFQGDEAIVVVRAARALEGDDATLFQHKKGPAEITLIIGTWGLTGIVNEWMARLPFTLANLLGLIAVFLIGRRMGHPHVGGMATCLLAIEGYFVAFGRIVQYQSLVFVLSTLGLLCLLVFYREGHRSLIVVGAVLFAGGFLGHYDAMLALPAALLLLVARLWHNRGEIRYALAPMLIAVIVALLIIGFYYLPFLRSSYVENTSSYVARRVGSGFYNNLQKVFVLSAVYDSVYYLILMLLALAGTVLTTWARWGRTGLGLGCVLLVAIATTVTWPDLWLLGQTTLAWVPFAILLVGALLAPGQSMERRAMWVWFGVPALFYLFVIARPLTHAHTSFVAWAILASMGLVGTARWLTTRSKPMQWVACALAVGVYAICGIYAIIMFVDHTPEYRRTFPESKYAFYWTPYEQIPGSGLFGFPYRAGWKVVGYLVDTGQLSGTYDSNEEPPITDYYSRQSVRRNCPSPDAYITAVNVQDEVSIPWEDVQSDYQPAIEVTVEGQPKLVIHKRDITGPPVSYAVEDHARLFDQGTTPDRTTWPALGAEATTPADQEAHQFLVGDFAQLVDYHVDAENAVPGGYVELVLLWQGLASSSIDYHVFTHLHDGEAKWGQMDGPPVCGKSPTTTWLPGAFIVDPYRIPVQDDAPPGAVQLTIGMYDYGTLQRLPVSTLDGLPIGDSIHLTDVVIREP